MARVTAVPLGSLDAKVFPATRAGVEMVQEASISANGRSAWRWIELPNGELVLGAFPRGELLEAAKDQADSDLARAIRRDARTG